MKYLGIFRHCHYNVDGTLSVAGKRQAAWLFSQILGLTNPHTTFKYRCSNELRAVNTVRALSLDETAPAFDAHPELNTDAGFSFEKVSAAGDVVALPIQEQCLIIVTHSEFMALPTLLTYALENVLTWDEQEITKKASKVHGGNLRTIKNGSGWFVINTPDEHAVVRLDNPY